MRKFSWPVLVLLCFSSFLLMGFDYGKHNVKATWVWQTGLIENGGGKLLDFAVNQEVNTLFLQIDKSIPNAVYGTFIANATKRGIAVHALDGSADWALTENKNKLTDMVDWVATYNAQAANDQKFKGLHLRIEAYNLPEWTASSGAITTAWRANLQSFVTATNTKLPGLETGIDLPYWLKGTKMPGGDPTLQWFFNTFGHIAILDYRTDVYSTNGIINSVKSQVQMATSLKKSILIAIDTRENIQDPTSTFYGKAAQLIDDSLWEVNDQFGGQGSYAGTAVHDISGWAAMFDTNLSSGGTTTPPVVTPPTTPTPDPTPTPKPDPTPTPDPVPPVVTPPATQVPSPAPVKRSSYIRATYVWEASDAIDRSAELLQFAKTKKINLLYLHIDTDYPFSAYRPFIKKAAAAGIEVHAMGGRGNMAFTENRDQITKLINYVKNYNRQADADERLFGLHFDIEPWVLPEWFTDTDRLIREWTGNMNYYVAELKKDSTLQTSVDISAWLDRFVVKDEGNVSLSKWFIAKMDHVTIMDFRNFAVGSGGIVDMASQELAFADALGKPLILAVESKESNEGAHVSFFALGSAFMESELGKLPTLLSSHKSFTGIAVHAYEYWKALKP
ncbi:hypothetical protein J2Z69_000898 [Paenibacillus shirakamiensis]|uniref:Uncharacterized protein n=1 Tax=Paenibacillus shirakamiensis TaxID=1265935 RepID=A0ABS4JDU3_9BACL|nr:hypothetical protein [Paenibacillus shirakamiensis]MBP1999879.1 hypothetical protein [Paenibacillus shirakamiensis]